MILHESGRFFYGRVGIYRLIDKEWQPFNY